jgi:hypothetical protein
MNRTLHILRKDMRRLRWVLALWLAVLVARVMLTLNGAAAPDEAPETGLFFRELSAAIAMAELLMTALIVARLVHEDALVGYTAFWLTRPYDTGDLVRAKLLLAGGVLVALPVIADLTTMALLAAGPPALIRAGSTEAVGYITWMLSLMVIATLTPSLGVFVLTIVGIVAGTSMLLATMLGLAEVWMDDAPGYTPPGVPDATPGIVMLAVYLCAALAIIVYQYRHRRWRVAAGLAVAGLGATLLVTALWPWSFARAEEIRPAAWAEGAVAVHDSSWGTEVSDVERFGRGTARRHVNARLTLSGTPPQVTLQSVGVRSRLQFDDGTSVESSQTGGFNSSFTTAAVEAALGDVAVLNPRDVVDPRQAWSPMITLTDEEFVRYRGRVGRLETNVDFHLLRTRELGTLPLTPGAALDDGVSRLEVMAIRRRPDSRDVIARRWRASSLMSTELPSQELFVLRHRARGEALMGGVETGWPMASRGNAAIGLFAMPFRMMGMDTSVSSSSGGGFSAGTMVLRFPGRGFGKAPHVDAAWYDEAELVVLETSPDGMVTRPLTIDPFAVPAE